MRFHVDLQSHNIYSIMCRRCTEIIKYYILCSIQMLYCILCSIQILYCILCSIQMFNGYGDLVFQFGMVDENEKAYIDNHTQKGVDFMKNKDFYDAFLVERLDSQPKCLSCCSRQATVAQQIIT